MTLLAYVTTRTGLLLAPLFERGFLQEGGVGGGGVGSPAGGDGTPSSPPGSGLIGLLPFVAIGLIFWFLIISPERKRQKQRTAMLAELKKGDRVLTTAGMFATVAQVHEHVVTLQLADSVRVKAARWAVQQIVENEDQVAGEPEQTRR